jgi:hypothetical protein
MIERAIAQTLSYHTPHKSSARRAGPYPTSHHRRAPQNQRDAASPTPRLLRARRRFPSACPPVAPELRTHWRCSALCGARAIPSLRFASSSTSPSASPRSPSSSSLPSTPPHPRPQNFRLQPPASRCQLWPASDATKMHRRRHHCSAASTVSHRLSVPLQLSAHTPVRTKQPANDVSPSVSVASNSTATTHLSPPKSPCHHPSALHPWVSTLHRVMNREQNPPFKPPAKQLHSPRPVRPSPSAIPCPHCTALHPSPSSIAAGAVCRSSAAITPAPRYTHTRSSVALACVTPNRRLIADSPPQFFVTVVTVTVTVTVNLSN